MMLIDLRKKNSVQSSLEFGVKKFLEILVLSCVGIQNSTRSASALIKMVENFSKKFTSSHVKRSQEKEGDLVVGSRRHRHKFIPVFSMYLLRESNYSIRNDVKHRKTNTNASNQMDGLIKKNPIIESDRKKIIASRFEIQNFNS